MAKIDELRDEEENEQFENVGQLVGYKTTVFIMSYVLVLGGGKLLSLIDVSWWVVFAPALFIAAVFFSFVLAVAIGAMVSTLVNITFK